MDELHHRRSPRRRRASLVLALIGAACGRHASGPSGADPRPLATVEFRSGTLQLTSAQPAPGSRISVDNCDRLCRSSGPELHFRFTPREGLIAVAVAVDFVDALNRPCAFGSSESVATPSTGPIDLRLSGVTFTDCSYAGSFVPVRTQARLLVNRVAPPGLGAEAADIPLPYSFSGPTLSREATAPYVVSIEWDANAGPTGGDKPIPGDNASYGCRANDLDGDALTMEIRFQDVGGRCPGASCWAGAWEFAPRPFPYAISAGTRRVHPADPFGLGFDLTCTVTDSRGLRAARVEHFK